MACLIFPLSGVNYLTGYELLPIFFLRDGEVPRGIVEPGKVAYIFANLSRAWPEFATYIQLGGAAGASELSSQTGGEGIGRVFYLLGQIVPQPTFRRYSPPRDHSQAPTKRDFLFDTEATASCNAYN